jgi:hypothetical protein
MSNWGNELARAYRLSEGETAYKEGKASGVRKMNPYQEGTEDYNLWSEGYHAASWQDTMKF